MDINPSTQTIEEFWGLELTKNKKEVKWEEEDDEELDTMSETVLELRQACLGASAKESERNVVEVMTENSEGDMVTHTILSLRVGGTEQSALFLTLHSPVTFKLAQGSGPVHITGQKNQTFNLDMLDSDSDDEEEEEEQEIPKMEIDAKKAITSSKKRPADSPVKLPAKLVKTNDAKDVSNGDNWDDDSEDDEDYEGGDSDDEAEDQSEEEESEESEEEPPPKPTPKKVQGNKKKTGTPGGKPAPIGKPTPNGKPNSGKDSKNVNFKTPQPQKKQKGTHSLPTTPFDNKKSQGKGAPDLTDLKQKLLKMSVPKKLDKFKNFVSNSFKIKDDAVKKQLWEYVQKNKLQ